MSIINKKSFLYLTIPYFSKIVSGNTVVFLFFHNCIPTMIYKGSPYYTTVVDCYCYCPLTEWLLFNANSAIFSYIMPSWREQVNFQWDDDDDGFLVLAHWNNSPRIDTLLQSDTLSWFRDNQSLLLTLSLMLHA
jgi:hypothetical protein